MDLNALGFRATVTRAFPRASAGRSYDIVMVGAVCLESLAVIRGRELATVVLGVGPDEASSERAALVASADDYIAIPAELEVLDARLRLHLRRALDTDGSRLTVGRISLDPPAHAVFVDGCRIHVTRTEFSILHLLAGHPGILVSRERVLRIVWNATRDPTRKLDVNVARMRPKLGDAAAQLEVLRGRGLRLNRRSRAV